MKTQLATLRASLESLSKVWPADSLSMNRLEVARGDIGEVIDSIESTKNGGLSSKADQIRIIRDALVLLHPNIQEYENLYRLLYELEYQTPAAIVTADGFLVESEPMSLKAGDELYLRPTICIASATQ